MNINRLLACLLSSLIALPAFAQDNRAAKGTIVIYLEDRQDRRMTGDFLMDTGLAYLKRRYEAKLSQVLPSSRYRVFTGADYLSGETNRFFAALAADPAGGPVDVITMSHSGGDTVETPFGTQSFTEFFQQIPKSLDGRLRMFYNAGCYGAGAHETALSRGFVVSVGTERVSMGSIHMDEFLDHYLRGDTAVEAARRVNAAVAGSTNWTGPYLGFKLATGSEKSQKEYSEHSSLKVHTYSPRAEGAGLSTSAESLPGMRAAPKKGNTLWGEPVTLADHEGDLLPDPLGAVTVRSVTKHGQVMKDLPTRLGVDFDGSSPYLPENIEVDVKNFDVTKTRLAPFQVFDNTVLAYERAVDRGVQHEIEAFHIDLPLAAHSVGGEGILARVAAAADLEAGYRHRPGSNTAYAQLHAGIETMVEVYKTVALVSRAEIWAAVENAGVRLDAELSAGARLALNDKGARLEAGYSRFYSDLLSKTRDAKDDFDAFLIGITVGR